MRYRHLGNSGLEVSETGLGANSFGEPGRRDYAESRAIVHAAIDHGINFIDTSNVYAQGVSEEYIGRALEGRRHEMLIGTKFGSMRDYGPNLFGGGRKFVMDSIEGSLRRLRTDYIDLYMIHRPDPRLPIAETLRAMDDIVRQGKALYIGVCNFESWRMVDAVWTSKANGMTGIISSQFEYSMLHRASEAEMLPACRQHSVGVMPYLPLAAGFLDGQGGCVGCGARGYPVSVGCQPIESMDNREQPAGDSGTSELGCGARQDLGRSGIRLAAGGPDRGDGDCGCEFTRADRTELSGIELAIKPRGAGRRYRDIGRAPGRWVEDLLLGRWLLQRAG